MVNDGKHLHSTGTDIDTELLYVSDRFPVFHEKVESLYNQSVEFQGLCSDYHLCVTTLGQWETRMENDKQFLLEYTDLKRSLEQELHRFLEKSFASSS
jgi:hypothetical protein